MRDKYGRSEFKAVEIWRELIDTLELPLTVDAFNGGKNRSQFYMPLYYHSLKVLEYHYWAVEHHDKTTRLIKLMLPE